MAAHESTAGLRSQLRAGAAWKLAGQVILQVNLEAGEERVVDIAAAMRDGDNTVTLTARGKRSGEALVLISD